MGQNASFDFSERYLPGLLLLAPVEVGLTRGVKHGDLLLDPATCRNELEARNYDQSKWHRLLEGRAISHDARAEIITAIGAQQRSLVVLKANLRALDELDGYCDPMGGISERVLARINWHTPALKQRLAEQSL